jgi:hypothetical protein
MELAKQGDPHAIAALINRSLESKGIHATADLEGECLKISLQASQIPNQKAVITIIQRGMMILQVEQIQSVKVLTYRSDNNYLAWQYQFSLTPSYNQSLPNSEIEKSSNLVRDQNMNLVSNPKGVILVQKLSQIQQNLQEYQDIIVRFTDEQVGTVRCLTTLTELIQVISKPSFLFAAVASNPNLRSLLDTIAESSDTDEHGDQVITNLSILQPGQQWQKAKIRLVTKIFLEPAQEQENAEVKHQGLTLDLQETTPQVIVYPTLENPEENIQPETSQNSYPVLENSQPEILENNFENNFELEKTDLNSQENIASVNLSQDNASQDDESEENQSDSLFDDFPDISDAAPILLVTSTANQSEANQSDELFDNFPDISSTSSDFSEIPVTNSEANQSDSLFDDFIDISPANSYSSSNSNNNANNINGEFGEDLAIAPIVQPVVLQINDETVPTSLDEDLFNDFSFEQELPERNSSTSLDIPNTDEAMDAIKSKIPKQNLNQLLMLMDEQDQTNSNQNHGVKPPVKADMGATTIERLLENMETIALDDATSSSSSSMVTLEDFSEDIGF